MTQRTIEKLVRGRFSNIGRGTLTLRTRTGDVHFGDGNGPAVVVTVHRNRFFRDLALGGHLGAVESYLAGDWDVDDLTGLVRLLVRNRSVLEGLEQGWAQLAAPLRRGLYALQRNTRRGSRKNIMAHYDLGNEFFAEFLDDTLTYSCGIFPHPGASMAEASIEKYDRLCRKLALVPEDHVVEIGSGWGGFAIHAASHYGCRVTTTTISPAQFEVATARIAAAGLSDRVTVLLSDYRDLTGTFTKLVSIEMVEAVGHQYYREYFATCARLLVPDGLAAIQAITIQDQYYEQARKEVDFIKRFIFPGSCIPAVSILAEAARPTPLRLVGLEDITPHYAETLRHWRERFAENWERIRAQGFSEEFGRLWHFYFAYCEGGFREALIGNVQLLFAMPAVTSVQPEPTLVLAGEFP